MCRSTPTPARSATSSRRSSSATGSGARCGAPPTRSTPAAERGVHVRHRRQVPGQRDQLEVDQPAQLVPHLHAGRARRAAGRRRQQVDVGADRGGAVGQHGERLRAGAVAMSSTVIRARVRVPRLDGEAQVAHRRPDRVPRQGLVEVRVRLGRGGQQQEAVQVEGGVRVARGERAAGHARPRRAGRRGARRPPGRRPGARASAARWCGAAPASRPSVRSARLTRAGAPSRVVKRFRRALRTLSRPSYRRVTTAVLPCHGVRVSR